MVRWLVHDLHFYIFLYLKLEESIDACFCIRRTGAMGEPFVRLLGERGEEVYVTSRRKREDKGNVHYIQGDAHDLFFIKQGLGKIMML